MRPSLGSGRSNRLTFDKISEDLLPPYRDFLVRLGFGPFLSIPSMHICHSLIEALWERFFAETGSYHLPTLELAPTPLDWSALLGIRFGGLLVPQSTLLKVEINEILGMDALRAEYQDIYEGKGDKLKINLHALCKTIPWNSNPDEFALRRFFLYFIGSCFLGQDKSTIPAHLVGAVRDSSKIGEYDWGGITFGYYLRCIRRFARGETSSFEGYWQFTIYWAYEHFPYMRPRCRRRLRYYSFPVALRWC